MPLKGLLQTFFDYDAHFASYSVPHVERRLAGEVFGRVESIPMLMAVFDIDCDAAKLATDPTEKKHLLEAWMAMEEPKLAEFAKAHPGGFLYRTKHGYRAVYILREPFPLKVAEDALRWRFTYLSWLAYLKRRFGIIADSACKDWTRLYRVPHGTRDEEAGFEDRGTRGNVDEVGIWECSPTEEDLRVAEKEEKLVSEGRPKNAQEEHECEPGLLHCLFKIKGWLGQQISPDKWAVRCPFEDEHTDGDAYNTSTVIYAAKSGHTMGWFHCSHKHCSARTQQEVLASFSEAEREQAQFDLEEESGKATRSFFRGKTFLPAVLADLIAANAPYLATPRDKKGIGSNIYKYVDGVYRDGAGDVNEEVNVHLGDRATPTRNDAVYDMILRRTVIDWFKLNVGAADMINVSNGMLCWKTGQLLPHDPKYLSTVRIPVKFDPNATCPILDRCLGEWLPPDAIKLMEEMSGYLLIPTTKYQVAFMLAGPGGNGKSTFLDMLLAFLGPDNVSHEALHDLSDNRFRLADLFGKLANLFSDLSSESLKQTSIFKAIVGGDPLTAENKFERPFKFRPFARLLFSANSLPSPGGDTSAGFFRRWAIIPFDRVFIGTADPHLLAKLTTEEAKSALLNKALAGLRRLEERGKFDLPDSVKAAGQKYQSDMDTARRFLNEECVKAPGKLISTTGLYDQFKQWCETSGVKFVPKKTVFDDKVVEVLGAEKGRERLGTKNPVWIWKGVSFVNEDSAAGGPGPGAPLDPQAGFNYD